MKSLAMFGLVAGAASIALGNGPLELVWSDEFDDLFVNPAKWEIQIGDGTAVGLPPGWGNSELQYYTDRVQNVSIMDGNLVITARRENFQGWSYTSARLRTKDRFAFQYGRVEARINLAIGEGLWPAFWMLPEFSVYGGWAASGEIDIMEALDDASRVLGTIHYGGSWPANQHRGGSIPGNFGESFHVYAFEWDPNQLRWYVDGQQYYSTNSSSWFSAGASSDPNAPFDQPFHLLINMAVGGHFTVTPGPNAPFPKSMLVDWIRVYQPAQAPFHGVPASIPGRIEAEDFDIGYQGQAYLDTDSRNEGGAYRPNDGVDLQASTVGGFNVGWMRPGEWIEYTVEVAQAGRYAASALVASQSSGGSFELLFNGASVGAAYTVPVTGGWQNWTTIMRELDLPAGEMIMRFVNLGGTGQEFNLNWFEFTLMAADCPVDLAEPFGVLDLADINAFISAFLANDPLADLAPPAGVFDLADITVFAGGFLAGCP